MKMFRKWLRQWWRDEGLATAVVLVICIPPVLFAVANAGLGKGSAGHTYDPNNLQVR
jgi:hypothetical protein